MNAPPRRTGFVPAYALVRPSGDPGVPAPTVGGIIPTPPVDSHAAPNPGIRYYQRILLGTGFSPGPQGADGIFGVNSANAVQAWSRWYNGLPEGRQVAPGDLKRGAMVAVSRELTAEKQTAMQRFASRASDVLANIQHDSFVTTTPAATIPWGTVALVSTATAATLALLVYAVRESSKKKAATR